MVYVYILVFIPENKDYLSELFRGFVLRRTLFLCTHLGQEIFSAPWISLETIRGFGNFLWLAAPGHAVLSIPGAVISR